MGAGEFVVGQDLESGRYLVTGSSNFIVYSASGSLKVILSWEGEPSGRKTIPVRFAREIK